MFGDHDRELKKKKKKKAAKKHASNDGFKVRRHNACTIDCLSIPLTLSSEVDV